MSWGKLYPKVGRGNEQRRNERDPRPWAAAAAGPTHETASAATCRNLTGGGKVADALGLIDDHGDRLAGLGEEAPKFFAPTSLVPNARRAGTTSGRTQGVFTANERRDMSTLGR